MSLDTSPRIIQPISTLTRAQTLRRRRRRVDVQFRALLHGGTRWLGFAAVPVKDGIVPTHSHCGLENVGEVRRLGLWRDTLTGWSVSREASNGVERRLRHPIRVVLFDRSLDGTLEPFDVLVRLGPVELVEDLKRKVGEERGLRTGLVLLCQWMVN